MTDAARAVGRFIRDQRHIAGMTQRILGKDVGCSQGYIGLIELGKHVPRPEIRRRTEYHAVKDFRAREPA